MSTFTIQSDQFEKWFLELQARLRRHAVDVKLLDEDGKFLSNKADEAWQEKIEETFQRALADNGIVLDRESLNILENLGGQLSIGGASPQELMLHGFQVGVEMLNRSQSATAEV